VKVTSIGHAGLFIETNAGTILCDPWLNPAYFASWFPFPDNSGLDWDDLGRCDYLYVSHLHHDHFDPENLRRHVDKRATVLLPEFPVDDLEVALRSLGFSRFAPVPNEVPVELDGLRVMIAALTAPSDGPLGDSALAVDDGTAAILNQNDARPFDFAPLLSFVEGRGYDGHFLQYSGAIWYPMVYDFPERMKETVGKRKRRNGMARALKYMDQYHAAHVFPFAGPPCFLDDELFRLNDVDRDEANVFPDQFTFLEYLAEQGRDNAHLLLTGTTVELSADGGCSVEQVPEPEVARIRDDRRGYLLSYKQRVQPVIDEILAALPQDRSDLVGQLKAWVQPLIETAEHTCAGLNGRILLEVAGTDGGGDESIVFDFLDRRIDTYAGEECRYRFRVARPLIEELVRHREQDWVNELFLSCRFEASRKGPYNEYIYTFFKSLSVERMTYVEGYYAESSGVEDYARVDGYVVQRHCPHLKADLVRFGTVRDGVLTCHLHGWEFELATGRCLTSDDRKLLSRPCRTEGSGDGAADAAADAAYPEITAPTLD
jgi:UDP-MurNAc hydroxylase